jgi:DNA-binding NarL/FixJ family response regulator
MNAAKTTRLLIIDDNDLVCDALGRWFGRNPAFEFLGAVTDGKAALEAVQRLEPDIVLLDIDIPNRSGLDILAEIIRARPEARVLMLSGHLKREYIEKSLKLGARGYVLKDVRVPDLAEMIHRAAAGEQVLCNASQAALRGVDESVILASS